MKKTIFFAAAVLFLSACSGKSNSDSANDSVQAEEQVDVEALRMDSINKLQAVAFENPAVLPYVNLGDDNKLYLEANGNLGYNDVDMANGKYEKDNGAYLMFWGMGDVPSTLSVIVGDTYYPIYDSTEESGEKFEYLNNYFMSNFFTEEHPFAGVVTYDAKSNSISYKTSAEEMGTVKLTDLPKDSLKTVNWAPQQ